MAGYKGLSPNAFTGRKELLEAAAKRRASGSTAQTISGLLGSTIGGIGGAIAGGPAGAAAGVAAGNSLGQGLYKVFDGEDETSGTGDLVNGAAAGLQGYAGLGAGAKEAAMNKAIMALLKKAGQ